jgi:glycosyltransferase involved in cell wall biosynthesis
MTSKPRISFCTHFYNGAHILQTQIDELKKLSDEFRHQVELLMVDDYSDEPYELDVSGLSAKLYRVTTDIDWNMAGCKNLLMTQAQADWLLYFDNDNYVPANQIEILLTHLGNLGPATVFYFRRLIDGKDVEAHINTFLVHKTALNTVGGFDEDFCGHYGYEDIHFINLLEKFGIQRRLIPEIGFVQQNYRTEKLSRESNRNRELLQFKISDGLRTENAKLRFEWAQIYARTIVTQT